MLETRSDTERRRVNHGKNGREVSGKLGRRYSAFSLKQLAKLGLYGSRGYIEVTKAKPRGEVNESETALILQQQKTFAE